MGELTDKLLRGQGMEGHYCHRSRGNKQASEEEATPSRCSHFRVARMNAPTVANAGIVPAEENSWIGFLEIVDRG